jgi:hypothetical protein
VGAGLAEALAVGATGSVFEVLVEVGGGPAVTEGPPPGLQAPSDMETENATTAALLSRAPEGASAAAAGRWAVEEQKGQTCSAARTWRWQDGQGTRGWYMAPVEHKGAPQAAP